MWKKNVDIKSLGVQTFCDTNSIGAQTGPSFMDVDGNISMRI